MALGQPCPVCGEILRHDEPVDLDHRIPLALGGSNDPSNLRVVHRRHNRSSGGSLGGKRKAMKWRAMQEELRYLRARSH